MGRPGLRRSRMPMPLHANDSMDIKQCSCGFMLMELQIKRYSLQVLMLAPVLARYAPPTSAR